MWYDLNDAVPGARPPVVIETWTFNGDFLPAEVFRCETDLGRHVERQLLANIRNHEWIDDDKVCPDDFTMTWSVKVDEFGGLKIQRTKATDAQGRTLGWHDEHPIQDLEEDLHLLKPAICSVDKEDTYRHQAFYEELLGDILPVKLRGHHFGRTILTERVVNLMGMEAFFLAMYDCPDEVHQLMAFLRDNALRMMRWAEAEGLITPNSGNQQSWGSSYNFTTKLPREGELDRPAKLSEIWGQVNSQETVGIDPAMFREFCFPYYRDLAEVFGLVYYGCCEPVHQFWDDLQHLPNLKKISISPWTDQEFMGEALKGTGVVFSRKPDPNLLGVVPEFDEQAWTAEIDRTLKATGPDVLVELLVRDVYTVHGNLGKAKRAAEIARQRVDEHRGG
jgi:hypothetical protein